MVLDFVVYGFILPIICILIASKGLPQRYVDCPNGGPANDSAKWFYYLSKLCFRCFWNYRFAPDIFKWRSDVTIDERDGNQQNYTIPYSTVPILQREGRFKFDLTAGDFRSGNSQQSSPFFSGHGTRWFTTGIYCLRRDAIICQLHRLLLGLGRNLGTGGSVAGCDPCAQSVSRR